jgi:hypothetical protein
MKKLLLLVGGTLVMAACSETPTAPSASRVVPSAKANLDLTCRSGYIVAYDENGDPYCKLDDSYRAAARP